MNRFDPQSQESLKRSLHQSNNTAPQHPHKILTPFISKSISVNPNSSFNFPRFGLNFEDDLVSSVNPPVTVVFEESSICHRISLDQHVSYQSLAIALRQMFVDCADPSTSNIDNIDLSNAIPGHLIAYEDMDNDLLLAGDLSWKDFVRVAKRIRICRRKGT